MSRFITPIFTIALLLTCLCFSNIRAQADVEFVDSTSAALDKVYNWYFSDEVDNEAIPLEIGGCAVPNDNPNLPYTDVFYYIELGDTSDLHGLQINQGDPSNDVTEFSVPGDGPVFGISQECQTLNGNDIIYWTYPDNGTLQSVKCENSENTLCLNNDRFQVTVDWNDFAESQSIEDPNGDPDMGYTFGCRQTTDETLWFSSTDAENWELLLTVLDTSCTINGATRISGGVNNGFFWIFASDTTNPVYTLRIEDLTTGVKRDVDTDIRGPFKESSGVPLDNGYNIVSWHNNRDNVVRGAAFPSPLNDPNDVHVFEYGPAPPFQGPDELNFISIATTDMGEGLAKVSYPGGNDFVYDSENKQVIRIPSVRTPFNDVNSGPFASNRLWAATDQTGSNPNNLIFSDGFEAGNTSAWGNSFDYGQFAILSGSLGIPTLNQWGLISLGLILLIIGAFYLRRRKARA